MDASTLVEPAVIIAVITTLVQAVKQVPVLADNPRWSPTVSVILGIALGVAAGVFFSGEVEPARMVLQGLIYGLSACGLYSFTRQFTKKAGD